MSRRRLPNAPGRGRLPRAAWARVRVRARTRAKARVRVRFRVRVRVRVRVWVKVRVRVRVRVKPSAACRRAGWKGRVPNLNLYPNPIPSPGPT